MQEAKEAGKQGMVQLFKAAPSEIKTAAIIAIIISGLNLAAGSYVNCCLSFLSARWILKGYGLVRWYFAASAALSIVALIGGFLEGISTHEYIVAACAPNVIACCVMLAILREPSAKAYFAVKCREYAENHVATEK